MTPGLIERLEAVGEGSRELDREIASECGWTNLDVPTFWVKSVCDAAGFPPGTAQATPLPHYTTSLDAALALAERVLPGDPDFEPTGPSVGWKINLYRGMVPAPLGGWIASLRRHASDGVEGSSSSPALALCIAILKASATQEQG